MDTEMQSNCTLNTKKLVNDILSNLKANPIDVFELGEDCNEFEYLESHADEYIRTIDDLLIHLPKNNYKDFKVLEVGAFLGVVSLSLSHIGMNITALDIPEFISSKNLKNKFESKGITCVAHNLKNHDLPFDNNTFDAVIMCETLEHLNFNPLPLLKDINRILKVDGLLYIAMPNLARKKNRLKLLKGQSIHNPIEHFFAQLEPNSFDIVGLHWREYTAMECSEMLQKMGFKILNQRFYERPNNLSRSKKSLRRRFINYFYNIGFIKRFIMRGVEQILSSDTEKSILESQVTIGCKERVFDKKFNLTESLN